MHTDDTLKILDETTVRIGVEFRAFTNKTCPAFKTRQHFIVNRKHANAAK